MNALFASALLVAGPTSMTSIDTPIKIDDGPGFVLKRAEKNGEAVVLASGWVVVDESGSNSGQADDAEIAMTYMNIECRKKNLRCAVAYIEAGNRTRLGVHKFFSVGHRELKIARWSDQKIAIEEHGGCEKSLLTLDIAANRVTRKAQRDLNSYEEGGCPDKIEVSEHLGTFAEAARVFFAREPGKAFKASAVTNSGSAQNVEVDNGTSPIAIAYKDGRDERMGGVAGSS